MTTLSVRVPRALLDHLDALVAEGRYSNRTTAVRDALERLVEAERHRAVDRAILDGYRRIPAEPPDEFTRTLAERSIMREPW